MRKTLLWSILMLYGVFVSSQVWISPNPSNINEPITFNYKYQSGNTLGSSGEFNPGTDDLFIHWAIDTNNDTSVWEKTSDWANTSTQIDIAWNGSEHTFTINDPKSFFGLGNGDKVYQIMMIVRNAAGNKQTKNLYATDYGFKPSMIGGTLAGNVTVTPYKPSRTEPVTITFDATGTALAGEPKVYLHSGVATDKPNSGSFNVAIGNWGQDDGIGKMTNAGTDKWTITLPSANSYYELTSQQDAFGLNFLFRSADGSKMKKDNNDKNYHVELDAGNYFLLNDDLTNNHPHMFKQNTVYNITTTVNTSAAWDIYENSSSTPLFSGTGQNITQPITLTDIDVLHNYKIVYHFSDGDKEKTFSLQAFGGIVYEALPAGLEYGVTYDASDATKATIVFQTPINTTYYGFNKDSESLYSMGTSTTSEKKMVYLTGDFNNWSVNATTAMKCGKWTSDNKCEVWWQTLTGLQPGKEYVYQFLVDGILTVGDPYTHKVSDPWNDKYITSSTYPNLIKNPNTNNVASVLQTNQPVYQWQVPNFNFVYNNRHDRLNIYELHFRDFTSEGTYKAAIGKLDYLKELGINCIHVMPVSEFEGNDSWGYAPNYYFAADKAYGPADDLKQFIDEAHKRGIAVVNDIVLNHAFSSNSMARLYWDKTAGDDGKPTADNPWFFRDHQGVRSGDGHWGSDWNHTSEHTQKMVDRILKYWITEFKFDGFRFDFTKGFSHFGYIGDDSDIWASTYNKDRIGLLKRMVKNMRNNAPTGRNPIIIFEHLANSSENSELANYGILQWSGVKHNEDIKEFQYGWNGKDIYNSGVYSAQGFTYANWISYMESHDEERQGYYMQKWAKYVQDKDPITQKDDYTKLLIDRLKIGTVFNLFMQGPRMLWMWEELGYDVSIGYNGRTGKKPQYWEYYQDTKRKELYRLMSYILKLRDKYNFYDSFAPNYGNIGSSDGVTVPRKMILNDGAGHIIYVIANLDTDNGHNVTPGYYYTGTHYKFNGDPAIDGTTYNVGNTSDTYYLNPSETMIITNFDPQLFNDIVMKNGVCDWQQGKPTSSLTFTAHTDVTCDYKLTTDLNIPKVSMDVFPNVKFTLDKTKKLCVGQTNVFGTLYLDEGSHLRIGDETCTFTTP